MTFSLVARCEESGMFGVAVASSSPAVAARCAYTKAGIGAVASQNVTDPALGPLTLDLMAAGNSADEAINKLLNEQSNMAFRQILAIDHKGVTAIHSGNKALGLWADARGVNVVAAGNLLANDTIPSILVSGFEKATGHLGERLLKAMDEALAAGGEAGPIHSAGMQICDKLSWPIVDLRCDWTLGCPIQEVKKAWQVYAPQLEDYVQRALSPEAAPSFGVAGDE